MDEGTRTFGPLEGKRKVLRRSTPQDDTFWKDDV